MVCCRVYHTYIDKSFRKHRLPLRSHYFHHSVSPDGEKSCFIVLFESWKVCLNQKHFQGNHQYIHTGTKV